MAEYIVRPDEMKAWETGIIRDGVDSLILMENAAKNMAAKIALRYSPGSVGIFCGSGNNGGDGLAIARHLLLAGFSPVLLMVGDIAKLTPDARKNYDAARVLDLPMVHCREKADFKSGLDCCLIVDALFGTGLSREIGGLFKDAVLSINASGKPVCAVDIPSGIGADGDILGCAVKADLTVTFQYKKSGLLLYPGREYAGETAVCDIGIPKMRTQEFLWEQLEEGDIRRFLPPRRKNSNKGDYGKLLVVAGSAHMAGAAALCAKAAICAGSGLTTIAAPKGITDVLHTMLWEAMTFPLPEQEGFPGSGSGEAAASALAGKSAAAVGPGLGTTQGVLEILEVVLAQNVTIPAVLDADALNVLAKTPALLEEAAGRTVVTPHPGEMARLCGAAIADILARPVEFAQRFAARYGAVVVLKGSTTVIAAPDGRVTFNTSGNPGMAKGGSGDVLCGVVGALLCRGLSPYDAARLGCYAAGRAGDRACEAVGENAMTASDSIRMLGEILP